MSNLEVIEYMKKTVEELRKEARSLGIKNSKQYKKDELIIKIYERATAQEESTEDNKSETHTADIQQVEDVTVEDIINDDENIDEDEEAWEQEEEVVAIEEPYEGGKEEGEMSSDIDKGVSVLTDEERIERKMRYIEGAMPGTIVAFKSLTGKIKSAMVIKKSTKNKKFKLETAYGAQFIVRWDDIVWVRSGKKWPKGVYLALKGIVNE